MTVDTINQASKHIGQPVAVLRALKREGHPAFLGSGRVDCALLSKDLDTWLAKLPQDDPKTENWRLRNDKLRREIGELDRKLISREAVATRLAALSAFVDAELKQKLVAEWPRAGQGMPSEELQKLGVELHSKIVANFHKFAEEWGK